MDKEDLETRRTLTNFNYHPIAIQKKIPLPEDTKENQIN